jgi:D-alanyl-D-alanine carboxypeptidase
MQTKMAGKSLIIVLLDAAGKSTRINDAIRIKQWVETRGTESAAG